MRICLSMIVRNESAIIQRLLTSVLGFADEYCICDTGSTDNTIEVIENFGPLKGRVYSEPFVNFEVSRNHALEEARKTGADYILLLDADMILQVDPTFDKNSLNVPVYTLFQESGNGMIYTNVRLVRGDAVPCRYVGVTHEYFDSAGFAIGEIRQGLRIRDVGDGGAKSDKFARDIRLLEEELRENPDNVRYRFYLANSFFDTRQYETAIEHYTTRVKQGGWPEEVYYSLYRTALCYKGLNMDGEFLSAAIKAWHFRPTRAESIYEAMQYFQEKKDHNLVVSLYNFIKDLKVPDDKLFVATRIYTHQALYLYTLSAFFAGVKKCPGYEKLFNSPHVGLYHVFANYRFYCPTPIGTTVDFSATHVLDGQTFVASSPSILALPGDKYLLNVRLVNYRITPTGAYDIQGYTIITRNKTLILDKALIPIAPPAFPLNDMEPRGIADSVYKYVGVEDIKLAKIQDQVFFTGTMCLASKQIGTCMGVYDENKLVPNEFVPQASCEKNWVFLPNQTSMIYKWHPLTFGPIEDGHLKLAETRPMPKLFEMARGSTNGVEYDGEWWFVVHFVYHQANELRFYTHALAVFDPQMNLKRYTLPFKFTRGSSIEYCVGIVVEKERILLSHSVMDREAYVRAYAFEAFDWV